MKKKLLLITFIFLNINFLASQVWQVSNTPQPDLIEDISVVNNNVIWIKDQSNDNNGISISNDGGLTWVHKDYPALFTDNSFSIGVLSAVDANTAYIVVSSAQQTSLRGIYKTTDAGDSWVREPGVFTDNSFPDMVHFWDSNHGFAMGDGLEVYSYLNGVWTNITTSLPNTSYLYSLNSSDYLRIVGSSAYFLTNAGTIFKSADMGSSWEEIVTPFTSIFSLSFDFKDNLNGILIGENNSTPEIYSTSNGGQTWNLLGSNISNAYNKVKYIPSLNKYISVSKNPSNFGISYSNDDGLTWNIDHEFNSLYSNYIGEIEYAPNGTVFLGGFKYVFYRDPNVKIPDPAFEQALIDLGIDSDGSVNGQVLESDVATITTLDISSKNISDLAGISGFRELSTLNCSNNQIVNLSLINNKELTSLNCSNNQLEDLNLKNGYNTTISSLDSTNNPNLTCIQVDDAAWSASNWTNIDSQSYFSEYCGLPLTFITDQNFELALIDLGIDSDGIINGQVLTSDVSSVTILSVSDKNISNLTGIEDFVSLTGLNCSGNNLSSLNVDNNTALTYLACNDNNLFSLNIDNNTALTEFFGFTNNLSSLNVDNNTALNVLACQNNNLSNLNVDNNTALTYLACNDNNLSVLNIDNNTALTEFFGFTNNLSSLNVDNNTALNVLACQNNNLSNLNVDNNTALTYLACNDNNLSTLNVDNNTALTELFCYSNDLSTLNADNNNALTKLYCNNNNISSLSFKNGNNLNITGFAASGNPNLTCITVDDATYSNANWTNIDPQTSFSEDCSIETDFTSFSFAEQTGEANVDTTNHTINIEVSNVTDLIALTASFQINGATTSVNGIEQVSGSTVNDFTNPVTYTVTALNGTTTQDWLVTVTEALYCASNGNNTDFFYIGQVELGSIDNSSQAGTGGYQDFTSESTGLYRGSQNTITITPTFPGAAYPNGYAVWIDYNQDNDFNDAGELVASQSPTSNLSIKLPFAVDATAITGLTRMRVSLKYNGIPTACESFGYGEVEDYSINIIDGLSPETDIVSFSIPQQVTETIIDNVNHTINIGVSDALDLSSLSASFALSSLSAIATANGIEQQSGITINDFTNPLTYEVTAADGVTTQDWIVTVTQEDVALTYIPDVNFEQALIDLGIDSIGIIDSYVLTNDVNSLTTLFVDNKNISNLKGIEDFTNLEELSCYGNNLSSLNVDNNTALVYLDCVFNNLSSLNVDNNTALTTLYCDYNNITILDLKDNPALTQLYCSANQLSRLNVKNGANTNLLLYALDNPDLECIQVDDATYSNANWTDIDPQTSFSENCSDVWEVYIPDATLETAIVTNYLNVIDTNGDGKITFAEAAAYTGTLDLSNQGITDVTGLQAFTGVTEIDLSGNSITDLSVLIESDAVILSRMQQELKSVARASFTGLTTLNCSNNLLTSLDVSSITTLTSLDCSNNPLEILNVKNGNNSQFTNFSSLNNPNLYCVQVDDSAYANTNWTNRDSQTEFNDIACYARLLSKVFFQGPYDTNSGLMIDVLRSGGLIPTTSPYIDALTIDASVLTVTGNDAIIDWIWVELRDKTNQTTVVASQSALLQADGDVVNTDGVKPLVFDGAIDDYYIVLSHRNHLGVLTAGTFNLEEGVVNLDLKSDSNFVFGGTNAIKDMGNGSFALFAGDFNGDGQVQNTDKNAVEPLRGISGYSNADIDMNGEVQNSDLNSVLNPNIGKGQQFMSKELNAKRIKSIK